MTSALPPPAQTSKASRLRDLIESPQLEFLMEAHNGISARIVEEAGIRGIWASGLALSAQYGVRDNNEASWTQVVEMLEFMSDATNIPIMLDGDTGYGNFNNLRRLVRKLEQRGIAGVCIEDKLFPKSNSFIDGERQALADVDEFCGKIKAGKDSQSDEAFCVVARVEAFIAGWDLPEAMRRAEAYRRAGADAILIHSKLSRPSQIIEFAREWAGRAPLIIVPTTYYSTPTDVFRGAGVSVIVWANHMIRAAVAAMQEVAREIAQGETLVNVEDAVAPVSEIFRLQGADELLAAERRYGLTTRAQIGAIVLAASRGDELAKLTDERPKVMLPVGGKPLLRRLVETFKEEGIHDVSVVAGYKADTIDVTGMKIVINRQYATTGELASLACARQVFSDEMIVIYGDVLFRRYVLRDVLDTPGELVVVVDSAPSPVPVTGSPDYAYCSAADDRAVLPRDVRLLCMSKVAERDGVRASGRFIGMLRARAEGRRWIEEALAAMQERPDYDRLSLPDLLDVLVEQGRPIAVLYITGHWLDVNSLDDLDRAGYFTHGGR